MRRWCFNSGERRCESPELVGRLGAPLRMGSRAEDWKGKRVVRGRMAGHIRRAGHGFGQMLFLGRHPGDHHGPLE